MTANWISTLIKISLLLGLFVLLTTIAEFLALQDIWHDYVSVEVVESLKATGQLDLPAWSRAEQEWTMVRAGGFFRIGFLLINFATLFVCLNAFKKLR